MDRRAQVCFALALDDAGLPTNEWLRSSLRAYFGWATAHLATHPDSPDDVPAGRSVPRWSWGGLISTP